MGVLAQEPGVGEEKRGLRSESLMRSICKQLYTYVPQSVSRIAGRVRDHLEIIDLRPIETIRSLNAEVLRTPELLEKELPALGLAPSSLLVPDELRQYCHTGLMHWQHPKQFGRYLVQLSTLKLESYLEIGTKYGGTFVITVEYLSRFHPVAEAVGVDANFCPSLLKYSRMNPKTRFVQLNTRDPRFKDLVERQRVFDLVLIDGDHAEDGCRKDFEIVRNHANVIVFHDIVNDFTPGPGVVWREIKDKCADDYSFSEYVDQYPEIQKKIGKRVLGLGVAVRKKFLS
jgi:cephalosporin hydroxylase